MTNERKRKIWQTNGTAKIGKKNNFYQVEKKTHDRLKRVKKNRNYKMKRELWKKRG